MSAKYRLIHYVPDPFLGERVAVAALVEDKGRVSIARSERLPGANCIGGPLSAALLQTVLDDLSTASNFNELPSSVGANFILDIPHDLPSAVARPDAWVEGLLSKQIADAERSAATRAPSLTAWGMSFFQTYKIRDLIRTAFKPAKMWENAPQPLIELEAVSQWVSGKNSLLLMEPLLPRRDAWDADLKHVKTLFSAYRYAFSKVGFDDPPRLVAYVLAGGKDDRRRHSLEALQGVADEIVDTQNESQRVGFVDLIRKVGASKSQMPLSH